MEIKWGGVAETIKIMNIEEVIKQRKEFGPSNRIIVYTVDGRTGELLSECTMKSEYYDKYREDVVKELYVRAEREVNMMMRRGKIGVPGFFVKG